MYRDFYVLGALSTEQYNFAHISKHTKVHTKVHFNSPDVTIVYNIFTNRNADDPLKTST